MSYANLQTAAAALIKTVVPFVTNPTWVTLGDSSILVKGVDAAAILYPGGFADEEDENQNSYRAYEIVLDLLVRYGENEAATWASMVTLRDAVIHAIEETPHLGLSYALESSLRSEGDPAWLYERESSSGPVFMLQTMRWTFHLLMSLSGGEF